MDDDTLSREGLQHRFRLERASTHKGCRLASQGLERRKWLGNLEFGSV